MLTALCQAICKNHWQYEDGTVEKRIAYEVSVSSLEVANQESNENQEENTEVVENQEAI